MVKMSLSVFLNRKDFLLILSVTFFKTRTIISAGMRLGMIQSLEPGSNVNFKGCRRRDER